MTSICCTICEEQSSVYCTVQSAQYVRSKVYRYVENRLICKEKLMYRGAASFACKQLVVWQNVSQQQDISTKHEHQLSNSFQDSPILSIRFEVLNWHVSAWKLYYHTHSHQHCTSSVLQPLQSVSVCFALQIVQSASLHSFTLVFLVSAGISQSLGFERVADVPTDRAARVLSVCQGLE